MVLILYTTNREPVVLLAVVQAMVATEGQVHEVRAVATVLRRTPEGRFVAEVAEVAVVEASRQRRKTEDIGAVAIRFPTAC